jgi:type IV secretory pathway TrbL component
LYTIIGILMVLAGGACFVSGAFSRERSNEKLGYAMGALFFVGALACIALNFWADGWF